MVFRRAVCMAINNLDRSASRSPPATRGSYPIPLDNATTAGFLGRAERGPVNEPVLIGSFPEFCRYFGGHFGDGALSHAVHDFFLHGGRRAVVVRVTNRAKRAEIEIPTAEGRLRLRAKNPGRHEFLRVSIDYEQADNDDCMFNMVVQRLSPSSSGIVEDQEIYPLISTRPTDSRFVVEVLRDSRLVQINGLPPAHRPTATPPKRPGDPVRYVAMTVAGDDGDDLTDYDIIGSDRDSTGLFAFSAGPRIDVLAIVLPADKDLGSAAFVAAARYCEDHRAILIWDPPNAWTSADVAIMDTRRLTFASSSVITYFPRVRPRGSQARYARGMPASGAIAGMLAQRDRRGLWSPDESSDYGLRAALTPIVQVNAHDAERLARFGINAFVQAGGGATRLTGNVTLGAAGAGPHCNATLKHSRLLKFILNAIEDATRSAAARPDLDAAMQRLERQLRRFLDDLYLRGGLQGRTPAQAYFVKTRYSTATARPEMRLGLALSEPGHFAEYVVEFDGDRAGALQRVRALEAEQLFS
jgi:hypothetical protein